MIFSRISFFNSVSIFKFFNGSPPPLFFSGAAWTLELELEPEPSESSLIFGLAMGVGRGGLLGPGAMKLGEASACFGGRGAVDGDERKAVRLRI